MWGVPWRTIVLAIYMAVVVWQFYSRFVTYRHERFRGMIAFGDWAASGMILVWPLTLVVTIAFIIYCRWARKEKPQAPVKPVEVIDVPTMGASELYASKVRVVGGKHYCDLTDARKRLLATLVASSDNELTMCSVSLLDHILEPRDKSSYTKQYRRWTGGAFWAICYRTIGGHEVVLGMVEEESHADRILLAIKQNYLLQY